jgi:hypothetical protein
MKCILCGKPSEIDICENCFAIEDGLRAEEDDREIRNHIKGCSDPNCECKNY